MKSSFPRQPQRSLFEKFVHTMNTVLVVMGLGVVGTALGAALVWYRSTQAADLGSVSHTWIAELRAGEPYDSNR